MLLDRQADVFLAQRSGADGWLVKPLDALRLKRALLAVMEGGTFTEGVPSDDEPEVAEAAADEPGEDDEDADEASADDAAPEEEPATAG